MRLFDTHCHLDYLKQDSTEVIIQKTLDQGVDRIMTIATEPDNLDEVIKIAEAYPDNVYCTQGIHPHDAKSYSLEVENKIVTNLTHSQQVKAIGEIGLDYHYDYSPKDKQAHAFEAQMQIAVDHNLPVVIHTREAEEDTWNVLSNFKDQLKAPLVLHSFTSQKWLAEKALEAGFFIGFNGIVTFKNAHTVREVLDIVPLERLLLETDAPFLTPTPHRGKENAPFYLPHTAKYICDYRQWDEIASLEKIYQNSLGFFQIK